jgi:hypothetical protein
MNVSNSDFREIHEFLDKMNALLDGPFSIVKRRFLNDSLTTLMKVPVVSVRVPAKRMRWGEIPKGNGGATRTGISEATRSAIRFDISKEVKISLFKGRWVPCSSVAPTGTRTMSVFLSASVISGQVISDIRNDAFIEFLTSYGSQS